METVEQPVLGSGRIVDDSSPTVSQITGTSEKQSKVERAVVRPKWRAISKTARWTARKAAVARIIPAFASIASAQV